MSIGVAALIAYEQTITVDIIKCRFGIIDCTAMMKTVKTMYGYCKEGQPSRFIGIELQVLKNPKDFGLWNYSSVLWKDPNAPIESSNVTTTHRHLNSHGDFHEENLEFLYEMKHIKVT